MSHLKFEVIEEKPKTKVYGVYSNEDQSHLGSICWYPAWRQYVFEPFSFTVWSEDCLEELSKFLKRLREERALNSIAKKSTFLAKEKDDG